MIRPARQPLPHPHHGINQADGQARNSLLQVEKAQESTETHVGAHGCAPLQLCSVPTGDLGGIAPASRRMVVCGVPAAPSWPRSTRSHRRRSWCRGRCCRRSRRYIAFPTDSPSLIPLLELHRLAAAAEVAVAALGHYELCAALRADIALARLVSQLSRSLDAGLCLGNCSPMITAFQLGVRRLFLGLEAHQETGLTQWDAVEQDGGGVLARGLHRDAESLDPSLEQYTFVPIHPLGWWGFQRNAGGF